jgi:hypothetical protein
MKRYIDKDCVDAYVRTGQGFKSSLLYFEEIGDGQFVGVRKNEKREVYFAATNKICVGGIKKGVYILAPERVAPAVEPARPELPKRFKQILIP